MPNTILQIQETHPIKKVSIYLRLLKKALLYLWQSKSWKAFGIRVISRVFPGSSSNVPLYLRLLFPSSSLWVQLDRAIQNADNTTAEKILVRMLGKRRIFLEANIPEINLASLESKVFEMDLPSSRKFFERKLIYQCLHPYARIALDSFHFSDSPTLGLFNDNQKHFAIGKVLPLWNNEPKLETEPFFHASRPVVESGENPGPFFKRTVDGIKVWELKNIFLAEGCQVFDETNYYWYELAANPKNNFIAGYFKTKPIIRTIENEDFCKISFDDISQTVFKDGFLLAGRCAGNYFHWLIEYLPRLLAFNFDSFKNYDGPIIIEKGLPSQLKESLNFCIDALSIKSSILEIDLTRQVFKFERIQIINTPTIILDDVDAFPYEESAFMNLNWLQQFAKLFSSLKIASNSPKRVYLRRTNFNRRKLINENEIHSYMERNGFVSIFPEELSFSEQVELFANADIIVAQSGAALSNIIFCKQTCTVVVLVAKETKAFSVFSNLSSISGCNYILCTGPLTKPSSSFNSKLNWHFSDFEVPIIKFESVMGKLLGLQNP